MEQNETFHENYNGRLITVGAGAIDLSGILFVPEQARGLVILALSADEDESSSHQKAIGIAQVLHARSLATLIVDLFTADEVKLDQETGYFRQNTDIMQQRIVGMADWFLENPETSNYTLGYFAGGIGGAAALIAAVERPDVVRAIVAADGQLDPAHDFLARVLAPTLLIAAEKDEPAV